VCYMKGDESSKLNLRVWTKFENFARLLATLHTGKRRATLCVTLPQ